MSKKSKNFFWISYTDLMTSLFFVMLVLYILTYSILLKEQRKLEADAKELKKIKEIELSVNNIDKKYFEYDSTYKKHILSIDVKFKPRSSDINNISKTKRNSLLNAGKSIKKFIEKTENENVFYLIIIEGQASKDNYSQNFELSYERALSLVKFWKSNGIDLFELDNCELIIAGSGINGKPRNAIEIKNQRFLIHIIPKIGTIGD